MIDWSRCPDVERSADGAWRIKGTQIPVQAILDNAEAECSAEEADPDKSLPLVALRRHIGRRIDAVRRILLFAYQSEVTAIIGPAGPAPPMSAEAQARLRTLARRVLALRPLVPNRETIEAMKAAERGEVTTVGHPKKLLKSLKRAKP
jgi:hypothetical protein